MTHLLFLEDEPFQIELLESYYSSEVVVHRPEMTFYDRKPLSQIATAEFYTSPLKAIERVQEGGVDYFIIDMMLGNLSGYDVISNVARQPCKPKIWAYTAYPKETDIRNRFIDKYILKSSGLGYLFSNLEADILKNKPVICDTASSI